MSAAFCLASAALCCPPLVTLVLSAEYTSHIFVLRRAPLAKKLLAYYPTKSPWLAVCGRLIWPVGLSINSGSRPLKEHRTSWQMADSWLEDGENAVDNGVVPVPTAIRTTYTCDGHCIRPIYTENDSGIDHGTRTRNCTLRRRRKV